MIVVYILFLFWFMWTLNKIENHLIDISYKERYSIGDKLDSIESHLVDIKNALGGSIGAIIERHLISIEGALGYSITDSLKHKLESIENQLSSIESCLESR